ncbi:hypothetical protein Z517_12571 [Fonsecaea pedrosoi CBS 271.37]|uniref:NACHT-NTPase and P-loop NTPases N-terminal domain-containing protein n=1 Tax=Fonsecaea pedrosoi CBS 271.37 TaxID=1442368 RepID=A0A0D2D9A0_9EURO|nr:uncharacterized protein Z517_12571 [Fonsecaea pedrosoi CBS 271.37]KIW74161.1 hypothetical protein Z517_12571 [Fonsecaea pedrosoi CBS 271.37]
MELITASQATRQIGHLLLDCDEAKDDLKRAAFFADGPSWSISRIETPLVGIEKSLKGLQRIFSSTDCPQHPFREAGHKHSCFKAALGGCSHVLDSAIYNLNPEKLRDASIPWNDYYTLMSNYHNVLEDLVRMVDPAQDGPPALELQKRIDTNNIQATRLKHMVDGNKTPAKKNESSSPAQPKAQASGKEKTEGKRVSDKSTTAQAPTQSTHAGALPNSSTQSHGDHTGHRRGGEEGRDNVCKALKRLGILDDKALKGNRALWLLRAIDDGDSFEMVRLLLELGFDPNQESPDPNTENTKEPEDPKDRKYPKDRPLCYAAKKGKSDIVELLIKNGAKIDARNVLRETALLSAAKWGMDEVVERLLNAPHDADIETQRQSVGRSYFKGFTPLMLAVYNGRLNTVRLLLKREANPDVVDQAGNPLFHDRNLDAGTLPTHVTSRRFYSGWLASGLTSAQARLGQLTLLTTSGGGPKVVPPPDRQVLTRAPKRGP